MKLIAFLLRVPVGLTSSVNDHELTEQDEMIKYKKLFAVKACVRKLMEIDCCGKPLRTDSAVVRRTLEKLSLIQKTQVSEEKLQMTSRREKAILWK